MLRQHRPGQQPGKSTLTQDAEPTAVGPGKRTLVEAQRSDAVQLQGELVALSRPAEGGKPLPEPLQHKMGAALNADFSGVSIHEGQEGSRAESMGALAYAHGEQIHFAPGQYDPSSEAGQRLIGHELTHVVQQRQGRAGGGAQTKGAPIHEDAALEHEADELGARAARGERSDGPRADGSAVAPVIQGYFATNRGTAMLVSNPNNPMEGQTRWLENHAQVVKGQEQVLSGLSWIHVDVTTGAYRGQQGWLLASWITEYQEPELGGGLKEFCGQLCAQREAILSDKDLPYGMNPHRAKIERIYKAIYERGDSGRGEKQPLQHYSGVVADMVKVAARFDGKLQFPVVVPGAGSLDDLGQLLTLSQDRHFHGAKVAYEALLYGAHYCTFKSGAMGGRIIINVGPGKVAVAFNAACEIAKQSACAIAVKAFGPGECLRKLDSLIVYVRAASGNGDLQALVDALKQRDLPDATLTPMMTETIAPGMALAQEPSPVLEQQISFGQKRCILGYLALREASDETDCARKLADLFRRAGIDVQNPARETGPAEPEIAQQLSIFLNLLS